jgi:hypothetical protein
MVLSQPDIDPFEAAGLLRQERQHFGFRSAHPHVRIKFNAQAGRFAFAWQPVAELVLTAVFGQKRLPPAEDGREMTGDL